MGTDPEDSHHRCNQVENGTMTDICRQYAHKRLCKALAILLLPCLFGAGCSLDKGSSGDLPPQNVFLEVDGCLTDDPEQDQAGTISYSVTVPFDVSLLEAKLEVLRGEVDLVVGTENPPSDYFGFGRGTGTQKILIGPESREPMMGRPWFVQLVSPFGIQEECEDEDDPDWRLLVHRSSGIEGRVLLEQEGQVPACTPGNCIQENIQIEVPEDSFSMEVSLESREGDADLLVELGGERESLVSLNPGSGYDVAVIPEEDLVVLRGQILFIRLESWQQPTDYRLEVVYTPGVVEEEPPEEEPPPEEAPL
jgi:hypothetical protein